MFLCFQKSQGVIGTEGCCGGMDEEYLEEIVSLRMFVMGNAGMIFLDEEYGLL